MHILFIQICDELEQYYINRSSTNSQSDGKSGVSVFLSVDETRKILRTAPEIFKGDDPDEINGGLFVGLSRKRVMRAGSEWCSYSKEHVKHIDGEPPKYRIDVPKDLKNNKARHHKNKNMQPIYAEAGSYLYKIIGLYLKHRGKHIRKKHLFLHTHKRWKVCIDHSYLENICYIFRRAYFTLAIIYCTDYMCI